MEKEISERQASKALGVVFGVISTVGLSIANLSHVFFTWSVIAEEIQTGWGQPTNLDIAVLFPFLIEGLLCAPSLILSAVYFCLYAKQRGNKGLFATVVALASLAVVQIILFNVLIRY